MESKKRRVTRACDYCRSKRAKCDGKTPACTNCSINNSSCTYTQTAKKRGLPTGYIHDLEKKVLLFQALVALLLAAGLEPQVLNVLRLSLLLSELEALQPEWEGSESAQAFSEFILAHDSAVHRARIGPVSLSLENARTENLSSTKGPNSSSAAAPSTNASQSAFALVPSNFLDDIFQVFTDELETREPVALQYHGLSHQISGFSGTVIQRCFRSRRNPFRVGSMFELSSAALEAQASALEHRRVPLEIFHFPGNLRQLVDDYFNVLHPWLPMLDRILIIRQIFRLQLDELHADCNVLALLWAMLALEGSGTAEIYARNAVMALENAPAATIETIQAMVLLGLYFYQTGDWDHSWVLVLSATRMAMDVRLMRPASEAKKEDVSVAALNIHRERTWATVYVVNTLLAARLGRSPLIRADDWPVPQVSEEGWEEWEAWRSVHDPSLQLDPGRCLSTFNQHVKVAALLNMALTCTIDMTDTSGHAILSLFEKRLQSWLDGLPLHCRIERVPMVAYLHLCSCLVWFILCVRLSLLPDVQLRNQHYTAACVEVRRILKVDTSALGFPFVDHIVLMALNFPDMLELEANEKDIIIANLQGLVEGAAENLVPFRITWDLYSSVNKMVKREDVKLPDLFKYFRSPQLLDPAKQASKTSESGSVKMIESAGASSRSEKEDQKVDPSLLQFFSSSIPTSFSLPQITSYSQSPKDELDLFMLDTDFAKNDVRLDKFMRNLGYINPEKARGENSSTNVLSDYSLIRDKSEGI